jgi:ribonuclease HI
VIIAYIDGGARGNPGPAGYGVYIQAADGSMIEELYGALGTATNNVAEYNGLLAALRWAIDHGERDVLIRADSELVVKQMRGEYRVKNEALRSLSLEAARLARQIGNVRFTHVRRAHNELADRLVNEALDAPA